MFDVKYLQPQRLATKVGTKCHYLLRFYVFPVLQRMGLVPMLQMCQSTGDLLYHLSFMKKFFQTNSIGHNSIRQLFTQNMLLVFQDKDTMEDIVGWFAERTDQFIW